jgi:hypothetical protein
MARRYTFHPVQLTAQSAWCEKPLAQNFNSTNKYLADDFHGGVDTVSRLSACCDAWVQR